MPPCRAKNNDRGNIRELKMKRKNIYIRLSFLIILVIVFLSPLPDLPSYYRAKPPKSITDIESFFEWRHEAKSIFFVINPDGHEYFLITGRSGKLILPSGPSGYFFDLQGNYTGWSPDIGDSKGPAGIFQDGNKQTKISKEELFQRVAERSTKQ
jgi:hypothetical protein